MTKRDIDESSLENSMTSSNGKPYSLPSIKKDELVSFPTDWDLKLEAPVTMTDLIWETLLDVNEDLVEKQEKALQLAFESLGISIDKFLEEYYIESYPVSVSIENRGSIDENLIRIQQNFRIRRKSKEELDNERADRKNALELVQSIQTTHPAGADR